MKKVFYLIVIFYSFSKLNIANTKTTAALDIIVGDEHGKISRIRSDSPRNPTTLHQFDTEAITSLARYKGKYGNHTYFVAKENSWPGIFTGDSYSYNCSFGFNNTEMRCNEKPFYKVKGWNIHISSLLVVNDGLFIGQTIGDLYYCQLDSSIECNQKLSLLRIIGISYDSISNHIYVATWFGELTRCKLDSSDGNIVTDCKRVYKCKAPTTAGLTAVHVAYNAVWLGTEKGVLLKCPLTEIKDVLECLEFDVIEWHKLKIPPSEPTIYSFGSRNDEFLYAALSGSGRNDVWACDPDAPKSCQTNFTLPLATKSFLIVN